MKQKKFRRKLQLNKETIARLNQEKVLAGNPPSPCGETIPTEVICSVIYCYTINYTLCDTNCRSCITYCETCDC